MLMSPMDFMNFSQMFPCPKCHLLPASKRMGTSAPGGCDAHSNQLGCSWACQNCPGLLLFQLLLRDRELLLRRKGTVTCTPSTAQPSLGSCIL